MLEKKKNLPELEEEILDFWEKNKIFEKSVNQRKNNRHFVFYDGPPFATGLPHYGHILASTIKDVVPRYWTMRGFRVDRRWGWDCHGLPIENLVEQELKISGRKEIEKFGIKKFNNAARFKVLTYTSEWHKTIRRIGRFVDFENAYTTMDLSYMESVWWAFAQLYKKRLIYKDVRTCLFCPRCETSLSNFEIAMDNSYIDTEDDSVYVKLELVGHKGEFLLIWTTTPWTLPGNAAVAVNPSIEYTKFKIGDEYIWSAKVPPHDKIVNVSVVEKCSGNALLGRRYRPAFNLVDGDSAYIVVGANFVDTEEGTGFVHIAPAFGEEDFILGKKEKLPLLSTLDDSGRFNDTYNPLKFLYGKSVKDANGILIDWLKKHGFLWKVERITHRYPICWRCQTPLIYKVEPAWFLKISAIKNSMLRLNEKIDWHPEHLKYGRFGNGVKDAPDWNVSRSRFWGTPMPIWECIKCKKVHVIGSREEFHKKSGGVKNRYFIMRHGEAQNNIMGIISSAIPEKPKRHLTLRGRMLVWRAARKLKNEKIDFIVSSDFTRTRETAEIIGKILGVSVTLDRRLREIAGLDGRALHEAEKYIKTPRDRLTQKVPDGETIPEVRMRIFPVLQDLERKYHGKTILIVGHEHPLWILYGAASGMTNEEMFHLRVGKRKEWFIDYAQIMRMPYRLLPRNDSSEVDFHRPYVDEVPIFCECGSKLKRIPDVLDCWFDSGSMPFAEKHYPFYNKRLFEKSFPADFIAEYIAQTRGWFYTLHVLSTALFKKPAFRHAITTGNILSENGEKLSKSRQNFPDPWLLFNKYGVDAIRYYFMASPVMDADNINFSEKDVAEVYKKYSLILYNVLSFYRLYEYRTKRNDKDLGRFSNSLDRWILSRLHDTTKKITDAFDKYNIVSATRLMMDFVQDLSLWYVRRSRERIKSDNADSSRPLLTLRLVLCHLAKLIAPTTPFLAEILYQGVGGKKLSVHLEDWPRHNSGLIDYKLERKMAVVRNIVSHALGLRAGAKIKTRQPLQKLKIKNKLDIENLYWLIKDEVNVKEVEFDPKIENEVELDFVITPVLKEEGIVREVVRNIQDMRKDLGLSPRDKADVQITGMGDFNELVTKWKKYIENSMEIRKVILGGKKVFMIEREVEVEGMQFWIGLRKV